MDRGFLGWKSPPPGLVVIGPDLIAADAKTQASRLSDMDLENATGFAPSGSGLLAVWCAERSAAALFEALIGGRVYPAYHGRPIIEWSGSAGLSILGHGPREEVSVFRLDGDKVEVVFEESSADWRARVPAARFPKGRLLVSVFEPGAFRAGPGFAGPLFLSKGGR